MSAIYNDGTVQYGSRAWYIAYWDTALNPDAWAPRGTVNGAGTPIAYPCDNITINRPTKAIDRTNELGEPSGSVGVADFVTGSATLQLTASTDPEPQSGDKIICSEAATPVAATAANVKIDSGVGSETFYITSVTRNESKDAEKKISITFKKAYG